MFTMQSPTAVPVLATLLFTSLVSTAPSSLYSRDALEGYGTITTSTNGSIVRATINNPPVNLWDYKLAADFYTFLSGLAKTANTSDVKVVIISSANPDFFIDHIDIHALSAASPEEPPANGTLTGLQLLEAENLLQTLPIIFIAEINGRTTGAGNEFAVQCDIRYAGPDAKLSQLEVGFGELPGTGGVQFLTALLGRARALEYILSARSVDAVEAAAIGWVNGAFGTEQELKRETTALAERIATYPKQGLAAIKSRVNVQKPTEEAIRGDNKMFTNLEKTQVVQQSQNKYLLLSQNESANSFEKNIPQDLPQVLE